jgi:hypothetical protein
VLGYRAWLWTGIESLDSISVSGAWTPGPNQARCQQFPHYLDTDRYLHPPHAAPDPECECGFWFRRSWGEILEYIPGGTRFTLGAIHAWGRIIEHQYGFRAEFAAPICLYGQVAQKIQGSDGLPGSIRWDMKSSGRVGRKIGRQFDVPLFDHSYDLIEFAESYDLSGQVVMTDWPV